MAKNPALTASLNERLGHDLKLPINGTFQPISGIDLLLQDISQLLLTIPGERVYRPAYGCFLRNQIWENIDDAAIKGASSIKAALDKFEPRIRVTSVGFDINRNTGLINYTIRFIILDTDTRINLVFPFRSGTDLSFA